MAAEREFERALAPCRRRLSAIGRSVLCLQVPLGDFEEGARWRSCLRAFRRRTRVIPPKTSEAPPRLPATTAARRFASPAVSSYGAWWWRGSDPSVVRRLQLVRPCPTGALRARPLTPRAATRSPSTGGRGTTTRAGREPARRGVKWSAPLAVLVARNLPAATATVGPNVGRAPPGRKGRLGFRCLTAFLLELLHRAKLSHRGRLSPRCLAFARRRAGW